MPPSIEWDLNLALVGTPETSVMWTLSTLKNLYLKVISTLSVTDCLKPARICQAKRTSLSSMSVLFSVENEVLTTLTPMPAPKNGDNGRFRPATLLILIRPLPITEKALTLPLAANGVPSTVNWSVLARLYENSPSAAKAPKL